MVQIRASQVFTHSIEDAVAAKKALDADEPFNEVVQKYSTCPSKQQEGDLGWMPEEAALSLMGEKITKDELQTLSAKDIAHVNRNHHNGQYLLLVCSMIRDIWSVIMAFICCFLINTSCSAISPLWVISRFPAFLKLLTSINIISYGRNIHLNILNVNCFNRLVTHINSQYFTT